VRESMSKMSNAQAALIAAAATDRTGDEENVYYLASNYISWLATQDEAAATPQSPRVIDKAARIPCGHTSTRGFVCDLPALHGGAHGNDHEGVSWGGSGL
jgi:hypothetical protein